MLTTPWFVDEMARRLPDNQAVVDGDRALILAELRREVRQAPADFEINCTPSYFNNEGAVDSAASGRVSARPTDPG